MTGKKEPDGVFKYQSTLTGEYIQAHQYLAEIVVARKASNEHKTLPYKYWTILPEWKKEFKKQVQAAAKALKKYDMKAIMNALNFHKWCYSFFSPQLISEIESQQRTLNIYKEQVSDKKIEVADTSSYTQRKTTKGLLGKINGRNRHREDN